MHTQAHTPKLVAALGHIFQPTNIKQTPAMTLFIMLGRQGLYVEPRLVWISQSCLCLLAAEILGEGHHTWPSVFLAEGSLGQMLWKLLCMRFPTMQRSSGNILGTGLTDGMVETA